MANTLPAQALTTLIQALLAQFRTTRTCPLGDYLRTPRGVHFHTQVVVVSTPMYHRLAKYCSHRTSSITTKHLQAMTLVPVNSSLQVDGI